MAARAVVFAYHDVGVRCLSVLLARAIDVALVVTHHDDPREATWFESVERLARDNDLELAFPGPGDMDALAAPLARIAPDFIFSFYYRHMLPPRLLALARRGAYNMHGSLLPAYRGRAPVNWAVAQGARETGATLHAMVAKPDAGDLVDQMAVPILPDDRAIDVFRKVTVAAELVLERSLAGLVDGSARLVPQDLTRGGYFGRRTPEDGRIDWRQGARAIHDLVRAVAPPYPGAFTQLGAIPMRLLRTRVLPATAANASPSIALDAQGALVIQCTDGGRLLVLEAEVGGARLDAKSFRELFGARPVPLGANP